VGGKQQGSEEGGVCKRDENCRGVLGMSKESRAMRRGKGRRGSEDVSKVREGPGPLEYRGKLK